MITLLQEDIPTTNGLNLQSSCPPPDSGSLNSTIPISYSSAITPASSATITSSTSSAPISSIPGTPKTSSSTLPTHTISYIPNSYSSATPVKTSTTPNEISNADFDFSLDEDDLASLPSTDCYLSQEMMKKQSGEMNLSQEMMKKPSGEMNLSQEMMKKQSGEMNLSQEMMKKQSREMNLSQGMMKKPSGEMNLSQRMMKKPSGEMNLSQGMMKKPSGEMNLSQEMITKDCSEMKGVNETKISPTKMPGIAVKNDYIDEKILGISFEKMEDYVIELESKIKHIDSAPKVDRMVKKENDFPRPPPKKKLRFCLAPSLGKELTTANFDQNNNASLPKNKPQNVPAAGLRKFTENMQESKREAHPTMKENETQDKISTMKILSDLAREHSTQNHKDFNNRPNTNGTSASHESVPTSTSHLTSAPSFTAHHKRSYDSVQHNMPKPNIHFSARSSTECNQPQRFNFAPQLSKQQPNSSIIRPSSSLVRFKFKKTHIKVKTVTNHPNPVGETPMRFKFTQRTFQENLHSSSHGNIGKGFGHQPKKSFQGESCSFRQHNVQDNMNTSPEYVNGRCSTTACQEIPKLPQNHQNRCAILNLHEPSSVLNLPKPLPITNFQRPQPLSKLSNSKMAHNFKTPLSVQNNQKSTITSNVLNSSIKKPLSALSSNFTPLTSPSKASNPTFHPASNRPQAPPLIPLASTQTKITSYCRPIRPPMQPINWPQGTPSCRPLVTPSCPPIRAPPSCPPIRAPPSCRPLVTPSCPPIRAPPSCRPLVTPSCPPIRVPPSCPPIRVPPSCQPIRAPPSCRPIPAPSNLPSRPTIPPCVSARPSIRPFHPSNQSHVRPIVQQFTQTRQFQFAAATACTTQLGTSISWSARATPQCQMPGPVICNRDTIARKRPE